MYIVALDVGACYHTFLPCEVAWFGICAAWKRLWPQMQFQKNEIIYYRKFPTADAKNGIEKLSNNRPVYAW